MSSDLEVSGEIVIAGRAAPISSITLHLNSVPAEIVPKLHRITITDIFQRLRVHICVFLMWRLARLGDNFRTPVSEIRRDRPPMIHWEGFLRGIHGSGSVEFELGAITQGFGHRLDAGDLVTDQVGDGPRDPQ